MSCLPTPETSPRSMFARFYIALKCLSLSIPHTLYVLWNSVPKAAELVETFVPAPASPSFVNVKLSLVVDGNVYETEACDTLTDAIWELDEAIGEEIEWLLQTCYDCLYSRPAFLTPVSDRDHMRCYRDVPEAFAEVRRQGKNASAEALHSGHYFVNVFHTCAAWQPGKSSSDIGLG